MSRRADLWLCTLVLLAAAGLRLWRLADVPPGWRDDEVVETAVHAALVLGGQRPLYFPQAEGHEPLYHYLSAGWIALVGQSLLAVRLPSAFLGLLSVAALYRLARRLFGPRAALLAAAGLSVSFWGLMYARFKLRQVGELAPLLLAFYFLFRALHLPGATASRHAGLEAHRGSTGSLSTLRLPHSSLQPRASSIGFPASSLQLPAPVFWLLSSLCLSLSLYTYYAARAAPLILLAFAAYLALAHPRLFRAHWRGLALAAGVTAALVLPLALAIAGVPGGEARLAVVGQPLQELLVGQPASALRNTAETLGMLAFTGDPEFLYNIPGRPVFEPLGALLAAAGLLLCAWRWRRPAHAFLLLWLLGGLAPAFVSTPAASLGHTITAQAAVYLLPAIALAGDERRKKTDEGRKTASRDEGQLPAAGLSNDTTISTDAAGGPNPPSPFPRREPRGRPAGEGEAVGAAREPPLPPVHLHPPDGLPGTRAFHRPSSSVLRLLALAFLLVTAARDLHAYFVAWPSLPEVRTLYRADLHAAAPALRALPAGSALGLVSRSLQPADAEALRLETPGRDLQPRVFNPERAWVFPNGAAPVLLRESAPPGEVFGQPPLAAPYALQTTGLGPLAQPATPMPASFQNGFVFQGYTLSLAQAPPSVRFYTYWRLAHDYVPPPSRPLAALSAAPLPLRIFSHVLLPDGSLLAGDDKLDVDPATLQPGDAFVQWLRIDLPAGLAPGDYALEIGLYNPATGARVPLSAGPDALLLTTLTWPPSP